MQMEGLIELNKDKKMRDLLKLNSYWYKDLNRDYLNIKKYREAMKNKYKLRATDKIEEVIDNIDLISNVLGALK